MFKAHIRKVKDIEDRPKYNMWQNTVWMIRNAWKTKKSVLWICLLLIGIKLCENFVNLFLTPSILRTVEISAPLTEVVLTILCFLGGAMLLSAVRSYIETSTVFGRIEIRTNIMRRISTKAMTTSYPNIEDTDKLQKISYSYCTTGGNASATEAIWETLRGTVGHIIGFVIYLLMLTLVDPVLIVLTAATCIFEYFMSKHINDWWYKNRKEDERYASYLNYLMDKAKDTRYAKDIRLFGMRDWLGDIYDNTMALYHKFLARGEKFSIRGDLLRIVLNLVRNGVAYGYLITLALQEGWAASEFLLYFSVVGEFTSWLSMLFGDFASLHGHSLNLSRLREMLEMDEPFKFEDGERLSVNKGGKYEFVFENVSFRYPGTDKDIIKNLNLKINAGEKLAIVGLNGAGKTTLVKLMCGFLDPTEGTVFLNGEDIRKFNRRDYYKHFSAVFQDFSILSMTIAENITLKEDGIDFDRLADVIEKAGLTTKVNSLEKGYDTQIGRDLYEDGVMLSGGETQRMMLARALYKDAPVLVLDEPTAALDPIAESDLYSKYNEMTAGHTSVYISHRLASTRFCDRILYIEDGVIVEEGTHKDLMKKGGKYRELFDIQSKFYKEGDVSYEKNDG